MVLTHTLFEGLRVGLLGGSFNPAHAGHREISLVALRRLRLDYVWWLVTPGNPLKEQGDYAPLEARLEEAHPIADHPKIIVTDYEAREGLRYTAETLASLKARFSTTRFVWLMGADNLAGFHHWKNWRNIADAVPIAVFNRPGDTLAAANAKAAQALQAHRLPPHLAPRLADCAPPAWVFFPGILNPQSATAIRAARKR